MDVLAYGVIGEYTAREFNRSINEIEDGELTVRINSDGGSPEYGWGMIAQFLEFEGEKSVKVDGKAYSMGAFMCMYAESVEALDVSEFMVHRAAYPSFIEGLYFNPESKYFDEGLLKNLQNINASLQKATENKIGSKKFKEVTGVSIKELFAMDWDSESKSFSRKDVFLNASEAKQLGLVQKINKITPKRKAAIHDGMAKIAAHYGGEIPKIKDKTDEKPSANINTNQKSEKMTKEEFKSKNPEAYAAILKEGYSAGIKAENERVQAWSVFNDVDAEAVQKGIESGNEIGQKQYAEFTKKMAAKGMADAAGKDSPEPTDGAQKTEAEIAAEKAAKSEKPEVSGFEKEINALMGVESEEESEEK